MKNNLLQDKATSRKTKTRMLPHHLTLSLLNTLVALTVLDRRVVIYELQNQQHSFEMEKSHHKIQIKLFFTFYSYWIIPQVTLHILKLTYSLIILVKLILNKNSVSQLTSQISWKGIEIAKTSISTLTVPMVSFLGYIFLKKSIEMCLTKPNKESNRSKFTYSSSKLV